MRRTMIMGSGSVLEVERELEHPGLVAIDRELELEQLEREAIPIPRQWGPPRPTAGEPAESWLARVRSWTEEHSGLGQI